MKKISASDISEMPLEERIRLVEDIRDSIAELPESVAVPEWHKAELDKRLDAYPLNPKEGSHWHGISRISRISRVR